jgi:hypothetical protein
LSRSRSSPRIRIAYNATSCRTARPCRCAWESSERTVRTCARFNADLQIRHLLPSLRGKRIAQVGEPERHQPGGAVLAKQVTGLLLLRPLPALELGDHLHAARPLAMLVDHASDRAVDRRLDPHVDPGREDVEQEARDGLMALADGCDPERVELAGVLGVGAQLDTCACSATSGNR